VSETRSRLDLWVVVTCVAIAAFVWFAGRRASAPAKREPAPVRSPYLAFPRGASIVVAANLEKLRQSPLSGLVDEGSREIVGQSVRETCGFDPIDRAKTLLLVIPNRTEHPRDDSGQPPFGIAIGGEFTEAAVASCAVRVVDKRGGEPARAKLGSFQAIRDRRATGEVAVRDGGPLLLSEGWYLREMIDALDGKTPSLASDEQHATLRDSVGGKGSAILVTFISPPGWLDRMAGSEIASLSPLASLRAGAIRIDVDPRFTATLLLACPDTAQCDEIARFVERMRTDLRRAIAEELGIDPILEFKTEREKNAVRAFIELDPVKTARVAAKLMAHEPELQAPQPAPEPTPDQVVRPTPTPSAAPSR
jgi:hypothetical protein